MSVPSFTQPDGHPYAPLPVRSVAPLYSMLMQHKATTAALSLDAIASLEAELATERAERAKARAVAAMLPAEAQDPAAAHPGAMILRRVIYGLQHLDDPAVPEVPDTPAELLALAELPGWRKWLADMAYGAARWAEPPVPSGCGACRDSVASWCDECADSIETAAALDRLHDEIIAAPDLATALRLMAVSAEWRTSSGTQGGQE